MSARTWRVFIGVLFVALALTISVGTADAFNSWLTQLTTLYGNTGTQAASCQVCHQFADPNQNGAFNPYGAALSATGLGSAAAIAAVESGNADGVAGTNLQEIQAGAQPGWCDPATPNCNNGGGTPPTGLTLDAGGNQPPVANAGPDQSVNVGQTVMLDGRDSSDADGNPLTYTWSFVLPLPAGSGATLSNSTAVQPTFTADVAGTYTVQLIVNDGQVNSEPDMVLITAAAGNLPPSANAGPDQAVNVGQTVTLNGGGSTDPDGNPLTYAWSFVSRPAGSAAALSEPTAVQPTFLADVAGEFVVQLIVNDGTLNSAPDTVVIQAGGGNLRPTANAGPDQTVNVAQTVTLNGGGSSDPEASQLTYTWSFVSRPAGSAAAFSDATVVQPTFVADVAGEYVAQLIVNDGQVNSTPDTVVVTAGGAPSEGCDVASVGTTQGAASVSCDFAIKHFKATKKVTLTPTNGEPGKQKVVRFRLQLRNVGRGTGEVPATLVGVQNGAEVYRETLTVTGTSRKMVKVTFPPFTPTAVGEITWTVVVQDADPGNSTATAVTAVRERRNERDDDEDENGDEKEEEGGDD